MTTTELLQKLQDKLDHTGYVKLDDSKYDYFEFYTRGTKMIRIKIKSLDESRSYSSLRAAEKREFINTLKEQDII